MPRKMALVTGGLGFIGSALMRSHEFQYDKIIVLDSLNPKVHSTFPKIPIETEILIGKIEDPETWFLLKYRLRNLTGDLDVFHLASETSTGLSLTQPTSHALPNVVGTTLLLEFLKAIDININKVIHTSTRAVYGEGAWIKNDEIVYPDTRKLTDLEKCNWAPRFETGYCDRPLAAEAKTTRVNPCNVYGITKLCQEQLIYTWGRSNDITTISLRLQNVYGRGQSLTNSYSGILAYFVSQMLQGVSVPIFEGGEIIRDFVNIKDVVDALLLSAKWVGGANQIMDIGSGSPKTINEVASLMSQIAKSPMPTIVNNFRLGDVRASFCNPKPAASEIGYESKVSIEEGLSELISWASAPTTNL